ncbi:MAG: HPr-rel-A system PqqD family peptide chaperone [Pseudomonadales bacterium]
MLLHIPQTFSLILKSYGNETLLYHPASGDTLLLSPSAVPVITRLQEGPLEKERLIEHVAEVLNYEVDESFLAHMEEVLSGLVKRDIVAAE